MTRTTKFEAWLAENPPEDTDERDNLRVAIQSRETCGRWRVTTDDDGQLVVSGGGTSVLRVANDKARRLLLDLVADLDVDDPYDPYDPDDPDAAYELRMQDPRS